MTGTCILDECLITAYIRHFGGYIFYYRKQTNVLKKYQLTFLVLSKGGVNVRSDYCDKQFFILVLAALTLENRLAVLVSLYTGLRIGDVLSLKTEQIRKQRFTVIESKTGKKRRIRLSDELLDDLLKISGKIYVFSNRCDYRKPRTRQAVYKDLKRACDLLRISKTVNISPHSARKIYAVELRYSDKVDLKRVQELLNHSSEAVTMIYAMADELTRRSHTEKQLSTVSLPC